ncbi:MAG TPA: 16S rRNA (cytosine(1402)-N(4))-methyltransferase RsmH [Candidatus Paceibacterota bacterium]|nr:16S rRNA (cytosine(1402)-N(4))-methyltransferase RsmH [Candidatus Paceibacterota bacterium]
MSLSGGHRSVLLHESVEYLAVQASDIVVDATLGGAGHAAAIVERLGPAGIFLGIDADTEAIERAHARLQGAAPKIILEQGNFRDVESYLGKHGIPTITKAFFDLGWSGYQLAARRGFSFLNNEPLRMTYADHPSPEALTAETVVNEWGEESIADILWGWGEERYSRQIARAIVQARREKRILTSRELAEIVRSAVPAAYRRGRLHPATKTFQAIRIAVNDEIGALKDGLAAAWKRLGADGRIAVITFHSVEDRAVKDIMREWARQGEGELLARKPITPSAQEVRENPRSRSAKLRVIRKI